jgi:phosphoribosylformylglycinamidine synthase
VCTRPIQKSDSDGVLTLGVSPKGQLKFETMVPPRQELGLGFDDWDLDYYTHMFRDDVKRDPTNVELFDIAQVRGAPASTTR